ncbi:hypothetical protein [Jannaschia pohangensis]|uniref:Uncharacterized protein n=1 Tax=Jannaschia pohangensis TaxID=390807 RepID=A0A1I3MFA3_9RHOB|nr:hypothetical protein [Jannaschia pohangensis]SFI95643.1 hypothetical protein SAMN04488095_1829 [Jannaschia pohangensis]
MTFPIPPRDPRIHVFAVSDGGAPIPTQSYLTGPADDSSGLQAAVGGSVDAKFAEVFEVGDVAPMGLRAYLAQAHDIPGETLAPDAARLDGLGGTVIVLAAGAVAGLSSLSPRSDLTHIGSYAPTEADMAPTTLPRPTATSPMPARPKPTSRPGPKGATIVWIVLAALALAAVLILI